jgi:hypothetical protein
MATSLSLLGVGFGGFESIPAFGMLFMGVLFGYPSQGDMGGEKC